VRLNTAVPIDETVSLLLRGFLVKEWGRRRLPRVCAPLHPCR